MAKTLITGGAGFLGSHFCEYLLAKGHEVICVDNFLTGQKSNIAHIKDTKFKFIESDVSKKISCDDKLDYVLHLASPASPEDYYKLPFETLKVGSEGTFNALELARKSGATFLLSSTSEVYGDPLVHPQVETYWGNVNPVGIRSVYDEAKRFAEAVAAAYQRTHGVKVRIARIFNTYGPRMRLNDGRAIPNFVAQALKGKNLTVYGDGKQTRSFCYVSDLIEGLYRLLISAVDSPVNIGNPTELTILEMAKKIKERIPAAGEIEFKPAMSDDPKVRRPDISKAKRELKWEPVVTLETGLTKTIDYFKSC